MGMLLSLPGGASAHGGDGYRIEQIVADTPSSNLRRTKFTIAQGDEALNVHKIVTFFHPLQQPVIGGFSGGSSAAMATIDRHPNLFAGLFMWEGTLYTPDPAIRARNAAFCANDEAQLAAGVVVDPT